jgi:hypothetical protein
VTLSPPRSGTIANSYAPNPYTNGNPLSAGALSWVNPQSFQLISAGIDGQWGYGGGYVATASENLPAFSPDSGSIRKRERDNITNFTGGKIE